MKHKAKLSVLSISLHTDTIGDKSLVVRLAGSLITTFVLLRLTVNWMHYVKLHVRGLLLPRWQSLEGLLCA